MTKYCPSCGEALLDEAKFCKSCGKNLDDTKQNFTQTEATKTYPVPAAEKSHTLAIVLGYICAILIPLFGLIFAVYLLTRNDSAKAKQHGKYILIITVVIWFISFMILLRA